MSTLRKTANQSDQPTSLRSAAVLQRSAKMKPAIFAILATVPLSSCVTQPYYGTSVVEEGGQLVCGLHRTPVQAHKGFIYDGVITFVAPDLYLAGGTVLLDHGHGISSNFLHLSRIDVKVGDVVKQGDVIGAVGMTGRATGPHLHWGMSWFDVRIDPLLVLERGIKK